MLEIESFPSFPLPSLADWEDKIKRELNLSSLEGLHWITPEGIALKPLYQIYQKSLTKPLSPKSSPNTPPSPTLFTSWESLYLHENSPWKEQIQEALNWGVTHFWLPHESIVPFEEVRAQFEEGKLAGLQFATDRPRKDLQEPNEDKFQREMELISFPGKKTSSPSTRIGGWDMRGIYEGGGNLAHQLAVCLAACTQAYRSMGNEAFSSYMESLTIHLSIGTSFYREIAKFRVLPVLLKRLFQEWGLWEVKAPFAMAHSSYRDLGINDPAMNAVRHTLSCLAARLGGCQHLCLHPLQDKPDLFQLRLARNIPILLAQEGKLQQVSDPVAGARFLEELGIALGEKAWELFLEIEQLGGLESAWEQGAIQGWMEAGMAIEKEGLKQGSKVRIGENKYRYEGN